MVDYDLQTPMMKQILDIKKKYPDSILMTRMGDFYEMFFDDAKIAARLLDITLTSRGGKHRSVPLAGIPYHAADLYISKLVKKGHKVTICEQVEDPKNAVGLVKRAVTKTITPGAVVDTKMLDSKTNNYIISIFKDRDCFGITFADISTGAFFTTSFEGKDYLFSEIAKFKPREYIMAKSVQLENEFLDELKNNCGACINFLDDDSFRPDAAKSALARQFNTKYLEGFGISDKPLSIRSSGALIKYISDTQLRTLSHLNNIHVYSVTDYMVLDAATQRNLEICTNIADGSLNGTLFGLFDKAKTPMGARLVKYWLLHPLLNISKIRRRHDAVFELSKNIILHKDLRDYLDNMYDVERIISRIGYGN
ncbi:MAG: DNA mismatch repair protein MutS, partial [archaeon]|nr:DNA mismatch repair protein MutS [archaeon]